ncbi:MAG: coenzyme F420-0:L-glutamate ligase [Methanobrevibacter sp.]|nr:coenzyme F420-0:L-glutamate ligase [Methanobrevibacter sp.]
MIFMNLELFGLNEIPLVKKGDNISDLIIAALKKQNISFKNQDIVLIAETLISKSEGNIINLKDINPSKKAISIAKKSKKNPALVEAILNESNEIIAIGPDFIISETKHGFVCANAGIDESNVDEGLATPMPKDPDKSAEKIRKSLETQLKKELAVIITDTQGRAFRNGAVGVAIGCSGMSPLWERAGEKDLYGRELQTTEIATADELAGAASLLMGQANEGIPVVIVRGFTSFNHLKNQKDGIHNLLREKEFDVFRK